jgi:hypothetical protein
MKDNIDRKRTKMGLPQIVPPKLKEIQFIIEETGLGGLVEKEEDD